MFFKCSFFYILVLKYLINYISENKFWYILYNNLLITVLCTILSKSLCFFFFHLTHSKCAIEKEFRKEEEKMREDDKYVVSDERKINMQNKVSKALKILKLKIFIFFLLI